MPVTNYHTVNGRILGETTGGVRTDYLTDALGSVTATVNAAGAVVNRYRYKPYGALLSKSGAGADPSNQWVGSLGYRQTGKKYSDVYVRARHYDSANGRWTSKDPIGFRGGDWNVLRYVLGSPVTGSDQFGLSCDGPKPNCGRGWTAICASTWRCGEPSMGTTCLACGVHVKQQIRDDGCACSQPFCPHFCSCRCENVLADLPVGVGAFATHTGSCGEKRNLRLPGTATIKVAVKVDSGPYANDADIDINVWVFYPKWGVFWVCTQANLNGPVSGLFSCPTCYDRNDKLKNGTSICTSPLCQDAGYSPSLCASPKP